MKREGIFVLFILAGLSTSAQFRSPETDLNGHDADHKSVSLLEHFVPGITFQPQGRGFDFNLFVGYKITKRLTAGLGWNERLGLHFHHHFGFSHRRGVYGPRTFVDYKLVHGFSARSELEWMNTYVIPPITSPPGDIAHRKWVMSVFVGVKKNFRLSRRLNANAQVLYDLSHIENHSPYSDPLNFRFGIEFSLGTK